MTQQCALTFEGLVDIEAGIPLADLVLGDTVLGVIDPENPNTPRTTHVVIATLGQHHVPSEDPSRVESFLIGVGLQRLVAGARVEGILVDGTYGPGLFALESTPVLDRVIF